MDIKQLGLTYGQYVANVNRILYKNKKYVKPKTGREIKKYLSIPQRDMNRAKALGVQWDKEHKQWYINIHPWRKNPLEGFEKWW